MILTANRTISTMQNWYQLHAGVTHSLCLNYYINRRLLITIIVIESFFYFVNDHNIKAMFGMHFDREGFTLNKSSDSLYNLTRVRWLISRMKNAINASFDWAINTF